MRVGIFTDVYYPYISGVVTSVNSLYKALTNLGCEVYIICVNSKKRKYEKEGNIIKIPGSRGPSPFGDYDMKYEFPIKATKLVKELNLDIIHTNTEGMIGILGRHMGKKLNIPVVHTAHTIYEDSASYITKGHFKRLGVIGAKAFVKFFLTKQVKEIITPGEKSYKCLKDKYKIKQNVTIIPNGIDKDIYNSNFSKETLYNKKKELDIVNNFVLLWVGRLGYEKNIRFLINAQKEVIKKHKNCKLLMVGTGPEEQSLKKLAEKNGLKDNIIFMGSIPNDEVALYYNIADLFVTASYGETQGLTVIEAMACSLPVVAIKDESYERVITDYKNGIFFKDQNEYIKNISYLINHKEELNKMKKEALKTSSDYSIEKFAKEVLKVYKKAIKEYSLIK